MTRKVMPSADIVKSFSFREHYQSQSVKRNTLDPDLPITWEELNKKTPFLTYRLFHLDTKSLDGLLFFKGLNCVFEIELVWC